MTTCGLLPSGLHRGARQVDDEEHSRPERQHLPNWRRLQRSPFGQALVRHGTNTEQLAELPGAPPRLGRHAELHVSELAKWQEHMVVEASSLSVVAWATFGGITCRPQCGVVAQPRRGQRLLGVANSQQVAWSSSPEGQPRNKTERVLNCFSLRAVVEP